MTVRMALMGKTLGSWLKANGEVPEFLLLWGIVRSGLFCCSPDGIMGEVGVVGVLALGGASGMVLRLTPEVDNIGMRRDLCEDCEAVCVEGTGVRGVDYL